MAEPGGFFPFPATLDPYVQEFLPSPHHFLSLPHHIYYPFPPPPPPQPPYPPTIYAPVPNQPPVPPPLPPPSSSPTRTLLLSSVPTDLSESAVRRDLEIFGDVRAVEMERVREGIVTVHFYDLRAAHAALVEIRDQHMQHQHRLREHYTALMVNGIDVGGFGGVGNMAPLPPAAAGLVAGWAVWAQFMIPGVNRFPDGCNQGTLVVFNLDSNVSMPLLRDMFEPYGPVKEWRDTPMKRHQRFVEFYDVRDAAKALAALNGKEINGKTIMIEFSRPGGHVKRFSSNSYSPSYHHHHHQQHQDQNHHPSSASRAMNRRPPSQSPSTSRPPPSCILKRFPRQMASNFGPRVKGWFSGPRRSLSTNETSNVEQEMGRLTMRDTREEGESSERTTMKKPPGSRWSSFGSSSSAGSSMHQNKDEEVVETEQEVEKRRVTVAARGSVGGGERRQAKGRRNFDPRFLIKEEAIVMGSSSSTSSCSRDTRTTVMIKNIPNKYSQKLLLNMLDNHCIHCNEQIIAASGEVDQPLSSYDFVYLPIDFNNKCNVGYGFVNMTSPEGTLRLYKAFHKQHWEVFNSRKICEVTYARLQGLEALKEHFKNSKFACETEEYLPVVFSPPRDGSPNNSPNPHPIVGLRPNISTLHVDGQDSSSSTTSTITAPGSNSGRRDSRDHITLDSDSCDGDDDDDHHYQNDDDG
ncbi:terminal ear1-like protein, partial [Drosera capensis]